MRCGAEVIVAGSARRGAARLAVALGAAVLLAGEAPAISQERIAPPPRLDPDALDLQMDVSRLTAEQVWLHRGAVLARHCQRFTDPLCREEFEDYLGDRCGISYFLEEWPPRTPVAADSALTADESAFLRRLADRRTALRERQCFLVDGEPQYDPDAIVNRAFFGALPDSVLGRLLHGGFVVLPARHAQMFTVYEQNDYAMIPNFITVDAALHVHHLYFDYALRELEAKSLLPAAQRLCERMGERLDVQYRQARGTPPANGLRRALIYAAVAARLAQGDSTATAPRWVDPGWLAVIDSQMVLIREASESRRLGPLLGTVDYTRFRPRGHYARSEALSRYFRTLTWLGLPGFILDEEHGLMTAGLAIAYVLARDPVLGELYAQIYEPTGFYVGPTDDITPALVSAVADSICGEGAGLDQWLAKGPAIRTELERRNPTGIRTRYLDDRDLPQIRVMGTRYIGDAEILQRLTMPFEQPPRPLPSGLDLFGVMKVPSALALLREGPELPATYWASLDSLQSQFGDFTPTPAADNLYTRWLHLLRAVNQPAPAGAAACMQASGWAFKNLNASLASWAQLRHDTILYAKQSGAAECGGGEEPPRTLGYVEARPDVFAEMAELQRYALAELAQRKLLTRDLRDTGRRVLELFAFLDSVSTKEVSGQPLTEREYTEIRVLGAQLDYITRDLLSDEQGGWDMAYEGTNRMLATVADVHTRNHPLSGATALEEGVGYADELLALVEIEGDLYLTRGAVFSYYEFEWPAGDRLTDEKWQQMLEEGQAPPRPRWIGRLLMPGPPQPARTRARYSSGC